MYDYELYVMTIAKNDINEAPLETKTCNVINVIKSKKYVDEIHIGWRQ